MFNQHFVKTLIRFIFMILIGVLVLFAVNYFFPDANTNGGNEGSGTQRNN